MTRGLLLAFSTLGILGVSLGDPGPPAGVSGTDRSDTGLGTFDGVIRPKLTVLLGIPVEGRLASVEVDRGDTVRAGQIVASLECEVEELDLALARQRAARVAEIEAARVRIEDARRSLEAREVLTGLVTEEELRSLRTEKRLAEIALVEAQEKQRTAALEVDRARARLALRRIECPFDGVVTERHHAPGELVDSGKAVLTVVQIDPLRIETIIPVEHLGEVSVGESAWVHPEIPGAAPLEATVTLIDPVVDPASHTFGVRLELPNPEGRVPVGVRCRVRFSR